MSWRDKLLDGRIGSARFCIVRHQGGGGARLQVTEFPLRDTPDIERLGKKSTEKTFECFVIGENYMDDRDALIAELEKQQTQTLVHPYIGTLKVEIVIYTYFESADEGGMARFNITWILATSNAQPVVATDTRRAVASKGAKAMSAAQSQFADNYSVQRAPQFVRDDAVAHLQKALDTSRLAVYSAINTPSPLGTQVRRIEQLTLSAATLVDNPAGLAGSMTDLIGGIGNTSSIAGQALRQYRRLFDFGSDDGSSPATTPSRRRQRRNRQAMNTLVQQSAVIAAAMNTAQMTFTSRDEAQAMLDELSARIDTHLDAASDDIYLAMVDLRDAMTADIHARAITLKQLRRYSTGVVMPSIVVAYALYDDASREAEIVQRNQIVHPAFIPPYPPIEVLSS